MLPTNNPAADAEILEIGEGFLDLTLPAARFDHRAHLIMTTYVLVKYPEQNWDHELPRRIQAFNVAKGGVNDATRGYHHTITTAFLAAVRAVLDRAEPQNLPDACRNVLDSPLIEREYLLCYWSREALFSVEARTSMIEPDLHPERWHEHIASPRAEAYQRKNPDNPQMLGLRDHTSRRGA